MEQVQSQQISWNISFKNLPITSYDRRITLKLFLIFFGVTVGVAIIYGFCVGSFEINRHSYFFVILVTAALQFIVFLIHSTFIWPKGKTKNIDFSYTLSEHGILIVYKSLDRTSRRHLSWESITTYKCPITEKSLLYKLSLGLNIRSFQLEAEKNNVKPFVVWSYVLPVSGKSYPYLLYTPENLNHSVKAYIEQHAGTTGKRVARWFSRLLLFFLVGIILIVFRYFLLM